MNERLHNDISVPHDMQYCNILRYNLLDEVMKLLYIYTYISWHFSRNYPHEAFRIDLRYRISFSFKSLNTVGNEKILCTYALSTCLIENCPVGNIVSMANQRSLYQCNRRINLDAENLSLWCQQSKESKVHMLNFSKLNSSLLQN